MSKAPTYETLSERLLMRTAIGVFLFSLAQIFDVTGKLVEGQIAQVLDVFSLGLLVVAVAVILPSFVKLIVSYRREKHRGGTPEDFIMEVYRGAAERAFALTFIFLLGLEVMSRHMPVMTTEISIKISLAFMMGTFAIVFFWKGRQSSGSEGDLGNLGA